MSAARPTSAILAVPSLASSTLLDLRSRCATLQSWCSHGAQYAGLRCLPKWRHGLHGSPCACSCQPAKHPLLPEHVLSNELA